MSEEFKHCLDCYDPVMCGNVSVCFKRPPRGRKAMTDHAQIKRLAEEALEQLAPHSPVWVNHIWRYIRDLQEAKPVDEIARDVVLKFRELTMTVNQTPLFLLYERDGSLTHPALLLQRLVVEALKTALAGRQH